MNMFNETPYPLLPLDKIAKLVGGGTPKRAESSYFGGDIDWVTPTDLTPIGQVRTLGKVSETITKEGLKRSSAKLLPTGTVLFSSRASIGKIAITNRPCATNQGFANFIVDENKVDSWYLAYALSYGTPGIEALCGQTTYKEVSKKKLKTFEIPYPPLNEQRRLVARIRECFERVDAVRGLREEAILSAEALVTARRREVWNELAQKYELRPLCELTESTRNGLYKPAKFYGSGTLFIRMYNVQSGRLVLDQIDRVEADPKEAKKYALALGDLLVSRVNSRELVGKSAIVDELPEPAVYEAMTIRLRVDRDVLNPAFAAEMMNAPHALLDLRGRAKHAIGQSSINQTDLGRTKLPLPSLTTQQALARELRLFGEQARALLDQQRDQAKQEAQLTQSILAQAFAGDL